MIGKRGQEGAPFELLVAVVIMGFVLVAGFRVIQVLQVEECKGRLDNNMELIKTAIENVAQGEGQRSVYFSLPECYPQQDSMLEVKHRTEKAICSEFCPGARIECTLLTFNSPEHSNWKCLRISSATDFPQSCEDFDESEYEVSRWNIAPIEEGQYILVKKFNEFSQQPRICAYKKVI